MTENIELFPYQSEISLSLKEKLILVQMFDKGYRFVTRDPDSDLFRIMFWSHKPSRHKDIGNDWGYKVSDLNKPDLLFADARESFDIQFLRKHGLGTKKPFPISDLLR